MEPKLYYTAPNDEAFEEMKAACIAQWETHDNTYGYVTEKVSRIKDIKNVKDNFMYMFAMFDWNGQWHIVQRLSDETKAALKERMIDGGNDDSYLKLIGL